jgi:hypothetical protein
MEFSQVGPTALQRGAKSTLDVAGLSLQDRLKLLHPCVDGTVVSTHVSDKRERERIRKTKERDAVIGAYRA